MSHKLSHNVYQRLRSDAIVHVPLGAQRLGAEVVLTLLAETLVPPEVVLTDTRRNYQWRVVMSVAESRSEWQAKIRLPDSMTIVTYHFVVNGEIYQEKRQLESRDTEFGNWPTYGEWVDAPFKIPVYDPARMPAEWTKGMVVYQIFPDRFAKTQSDDSAASAMKGVYGHEPMLVTWGDKPEDPPLGRDFFGGDLRGIIEKLDYLQSLGVECLYLNPIFEASSNHRYDVIDYLKIDQMLGTEADFDELIAQAHQRGIKLVLDAVFNHCSSDSIYFDITGKFGIGATQSPESPYYRWFNFKHWPDEYDGWIGLGFMPEFVESPEMMHFFLGQGGITEYWLNKGIDGWRADVPFDNTFNFWQRFRERVDAVKPSAWVIAEEWRDASHYLLGDTFNSTMNYRLAWAVRGFFAMEYLTPSEFEDRLFLHRQDTPLPALHSQMNLLDSHDTDRLLTACGGNMERFMQAFAFLFAYPGAPTVFYGTEGALVGKFPEDSRRCFNWETPNETLEAFFSHMMNLRKSNDVLRYGDVETVLLDDVKRLYGIRRYVGDKSVYAVFNASRRTQTVALPLQEGELGTWHDLLGNLESVTVEDSMLNFELPARGYVWLTQ
jgi:cyclomaltodextrinase